MLASPPSPRTSKRAITPQRMMALGISRSWPISSADLCPSNDDDKGNNQPDAHVDRQDNRTSGGGDACHERSPITAARLNRVKLIVFLML